MDGYGQSGTFTYSGDAFYRSDGLIVLAGKLVQISFIVHPRE